MTTGQTSSPCAFCEGSGIWADSAGGPPDPCPLCDGSGRVGVAGGAERVAAEEPASLPRVLRSVRDLSQAERQRLYEELHAVYDCRIYPR